VNVTPARDYIEALLAQPGISLSETDENLARFCNALRQEVVRLNQSESRGRPDSTMFANLVHTLGEFFKREYTGQASKARIRSGFVKLSPYERERNQFVEHVLRSAGIYCPANIERYFRALPAKKK
jgi:hypothetical protein